MLDPATISALFLGLAGLVTAVVNAIASVSKSEHEALKLRVASLEGDKAELQKERDDLHSDLLTTREALSLAQIEIATLVGQIKALQDGLPPLVVA